MGRIHTMAGSSDDASTYAALTYGMPLREHVESVRVSTIRGGLCVQSMLLMLMRTQESLVVPPSSAVPPTSQRSASGMQMM